MRVWLFVLLWFGLVESAHAVVFEKLPVALSKVLNVKAKVVKKSLTIKGRKFDAYLPKSKKKTVIAFVQKEIYEPNCTHTWVIGVDAKTKKVTEIREVEMGCPHAFPARKSSFKEQFIGKGPASIKKFKKGIDFVAKATGTCELLRDSVVRSIEGAKKLRR